MLGNGVRIAIIITLCIALLVDVLIHRKWRRWQRAYFVNPAMLLGYLLVAFAFSFFLGSPKIFFAKFMDIFVTVFLYELVLMVVMKGVRQRCSAEVAASLWGLSNVLYVFLVGTAWESMIFQPRLVIGIPEKAGMAIAAVWALGFLLLAIRDILSHRRFCKEVLEGAAVINEKSDGYLETVYCIWEEEQKGFPERSITLERSAQVSTPITIGVTSLHILLPEITYTEEELRWIFRHELVHIYNQDNQLKFFIAICNDILWFFPPLKIVSEWAAEDIELSCDQKVISGAGPEERAFYADLILSTAGTSRGFTTCLSSTGKCVRYRLGEVLHPRKKSGALGYLVLVLAITFIIGCFGQIQFLADGGKAPKAAFGGTSSLEVSFSRDENGAVDQCDCRGLAEYLEQETFYSLGDDMLLSVENIGVTIKTAKGSYQVWFDEDSNVVRVYPVSEEDDFPDGDSQYYYLKDKKWRQFFS